MLEDIDGAQEESRRKSNSVQLQAQLRQVSSQKPKVNYVGHLVTDQGLEPDPEKIRAVRKMPVPQSKEYEYSGRPTSGCDETMSISTGTRHNREALKR